MASFTFCFFDGGRLNTSPSTTLYDSSVAQGKSLLPEGEGCSPLPSHLDKISGVYVFIDHLDSRNRSCHVLSNIKLLMFHYNYVTGSGKRDIFAHTMIFQYKRCCSKTSNIFYSLTKKKFFGLAVSETL